MATNFVKLKKNELMELHLDILKDLLNGVDFKDIEQKYSARFEELNYLKNVTSNLLSFDNGKLVAAYPVSPRKTNYKVIIDDIGTGYAMCAIDALGIAYTFMKKTTIETTIRDTNESFKFVVDPFLDKQTEKNLFVTYKKYNQTLTNAALEICPTINIYRFENGVPKDENLVILDFETAIHYARERFSQDAINQSFLGTFDLEKLMNNAQYGKDLSINCDC
ncbi:MAG: hypothetical protein HeimC2_43420 [Candidatus Heimdallarchaeota archaeon LC_2]|nr:MAG: hypothetical protein HeimC2_43420 [Candidatus Heimdallarchaeota archaeon LC_2]